MVAQKCDGTRARGTTEAWCTHSQDALGVGMVVFEQYFALSVLPVVQYVCVHTCILYPVYTQFAVVNVPSMYVHVSYIHDIHSTFIHTHHQQFITIYSCYPGTTFSCQYRSQN